MPCCLPSEAPNFIVIIKDGKYKDQRAVIQMKNPKTNIFRLRLLDIEKPFLERFSFSKSGIVDSTSAKFKIIFLPADRFIQTKEKTLPLINQGWDVDTSNLLRKFKTQKAVVEHAIRTNKLDLSSHIKKIYKPSYLKKMADKKKTKLNE